MPASQRPNQLARCGRAARTDGVGDWSGLHARLATGSAGYRDGGLSGFPADIVFLGIGGLGTQAEDYRDEMELAAEVVDAGDLLDRWLRGAPIRKRERRAQKSPIRRKSSVAAQGLSPAARLELKEKGRRPDLPPVRAPARVLLNHSRSERSRAEQESAAHPCATEAYQRRRWYG